MIIILSVVFSHHLLQPSFPLLVQEPAYVRGRVADAEWVLETFEPRVESDSIASDPAAAFSGDFGMIVNIIQRKEDEDALFKLSQIVCQLGCTEVWTTHGAVLTICMTCLLEICLLYTS